MKSDHGGLFGGSYPATKMGYFLWGIVVILGGLTSVMMAFGPGWFYWSAAAASVVVFGFAIRDWHRHHNADKNE